MDRKYSPEGSVASLSAEEEENTRCAEAASANQIPPLYLWLRPQRRENIKLCATQNKPIWRLCEGWCV